MPTKMFIKAFMEDLYVKIHFKRKNLLVYTIFDTFGREHINNFLLTATSFKFRLSVRSKIFNNKMQLLHLHDS